MERSSRLISLSGLSGVVAGLAALGGVFAAIKFFGQFEYYYTNEGRIYTMRGEFSPEFLIFLFVGALTVLAVAIGFGIFFTTRRAKKKGQKIWGPLTRRMMFSLAIPLVTGGIFCLILLEKRMLGLILPCTMIFYGLGLISASKYTLRDIHYLGLTEIVLGLIACVYTGYGLAFWALGFGVMHILYGTIMYWKYERND